MKKDFLNEAGELPHKVRLMFAAVMELLFEGTDVNTLKISDITEKAGIGKGTAYEYFESKEEVIGAAIIHYVEKVLGEAEAELKKQKGFSEELDYLFDVLERNLNERGCFLQVVHLMMGNSSMGLYLQEAIRSGQAELPLVILDRMVERGIEKGEIRKEYPVPYIVYTICARFLTYAVLLDMKEEERPLYNGKVNLKQMREMMLQGIRQEFCVPKNP